MYRHPHGNGVLYIVWLKLGMQVAQKSEYMKARFGVQRGRTNGLTIHGWWKKHVRTIQTHSFWGHSDDNCYDVKTLPVLPYRGSTTTHAALPCHSWPSTLLESRQIFKLDFVVRQKVAYLSGRRPAGCTKNRLEAGGMNPFVDTVRAPCFCGHEHEAHEDRAQCWHLWSLYVEQQVDCALVVHQKLTSWLCTPKLRW